MCSSAESAKAQIHFDVGLIILNGLMIFNSLAGGSLSHSETVLDIMDSVVLVFEHYVTVAVLLALLFGIVVGFILGVRASFKSFSDLNIEAGF